MDNDGSLYSFDKIVGKVDFRTGQTIFNGNPTAGVCSRRPRPLSWKLAITPIENVNNLACEGPSMSIKNGVLHVRTRSATLDANLTARADGVARTEAGDRVVQYADRSVAIDAKGVNIVRIPCSR
jgi:hypothetical protein